MRGIKLVSVFAEGIPLTNNYYFPQIIIRRIGRRSNSKKFEEYPCLIQICLVDDA